MKKKIERILEIISEKSGYPIEGIRKYYNNTMWLFSERAVSMVLGLTVGIAVARYLGPYDYGIISYGMALYSIAISLMSLGLDDIIVRDALNKPAEQNKILGTAFLFRIIISIISFVSLAVFAFFTTDEGALLPVIIILAGVLLQSGNLLALYFKMIVKSKFAASSIIYAYITSSIIKIFLILINASVAYFALAIFLDALIQIIVLVYFYKKMHGIFYDWRFDKKTAIYILKTSFPLIITYLLATIYFKIDAILINGILGTKELGIYSVAMRLIEILAPIPTIIISSVLPAMLNARRENYEEYNSRIKKILYIASAISIFLSVLITIFAPLAIKILYGDAYQEATSVFIILSWGLVFSGFSTVSVKWMVMENRLNLILIRTIIVTTMGATLTYLLTKNFGLKGAAYSLLIMSIISGYFLDICNKETHKFFIMKTKSLFYPFSVLYKYVNKRRKS